MNTVNVIELIENNPITTLSKTYNVKLLEKIQHTFSNFEQNLFLSSFYCYLNYDPMNDFIVELDNIWIWLGFSQKSNAKRLLLKKFMPDVDYKIIETDMKLEKTHGGHNRETILLNINTFKKFCLKSDTQKADEIHEYYMKLEQLMHDTINEEQSELRMQLQQSHKSLVEITQLSEYEKRKACEQTLVTQFPLNTECIYFGTINNTNDNNEKLIKFGHTNNLSVRLTDHRNKYDEFILVEAYRVQNKVEIENLIKSHPKIKKQIRNINVNGKTKTEIIAYNETNFTINCLKKYIKDIINSRTYSVEKFNDLLKNNDELSIKNEELFNENKELKIQLTQQTELITRQTYIIQEMKETISSQNTIINEDDHIMETLAKKNINTKIHYFQMTKQHEDSMNSLIVCVL
jgi:hypothetical protein